VIALADIFRRFWPAYVQQHGASVLRAHVRAAEAILRCRTAQCGTVFHQCGGCGTLAAAPVSCGHRACNACGGHRAVQWEARQKARLLPVPCHLVTFTIPAEFRELFRSHQRLCYDLFFKETAAALTDLAADPKLLGGAIGMTGVLQTWTRDLRYHPHIHYIVPAAALTPTGLIRPRNPDILVPVKPLALRVRHRLRAALKAADFKLYLTIPSRAWRKPWITDARHAGRGDTALGYLARYVQKTALDSARVTALTHTHVTLTWTDRRSGQRREQALTGHDFLQRFLQHVLPRGFTRVRHFGWLSAAARRQYERARTLLRAAAAGPAVLPPPRPPACPCCGRPMTFLRCLRPARAPPQTLSPRT
jgi:hypothetical protein